MVSFELDENFSREGESPLAKAVRLVREELDQVESRNQVDNYLKAFNVSITRLLPQATKTVVTIVQSIV